MFDIFNYRTAETVQVMKFRGNARIYCAWLNSTRDNTYDYDEHVCSEYKEVANGPSANGVVFVTVQCMCGEVVRSYTDNVL